jgi:site-specific recombinase XerD
MITITVGNVLGHAMPESYYRATHVLYVVRDNSRILYVGQAEHESTQERLLLHLAANIDATYRGQTLEPSSLGTYVLANAPKSNDWQIDLLTLDDCQLLAQAAHSRRLTVSDAEKFLIKSLAPELNRAFNWEPSRETNQATSPNKDAHRQRKARTLPQFSTEYIAMASGNPRTQQLYRYALQSFQKFAETTGVVPTFAPIPPNKLSRDMLVGYVSWLQESGAKNGTIHTYVSVIKEYLQWLENEANGLSRRRYNEMVLALERVTGPHMEKMPNERRRADIDVGKLLSYYGDKLNGPFPDTPEGRRQRLICLRNHAIFQTLYSTAGLAGEVAALSRGSIDSILTDLKHDASGYQPHPVPVAIVGQKGHRRLIFLTPTALDSIRDYLVARDESGPVVRTNNTSGQAEAVFVRHDRAPTGPISRAHVWYIVNRAAKDVFGTDERGKPLKRIGPRDFRHLRAQHLADDGMPFDTLQAMLGHASVSTTRRTYGDRPSQERLARELEQFSRDLNEATGDTSSEV